eukprot:UN31105
MINHCFEEYVKDERDYMKWNEFNTVGSWLTEIREEIQTQDLLSFEITGWLKEIWKKNDTEDENMLPRKQVQSMVKDLLLEIDEFGYDADTQEEQDKYVDRMILNMPTVKGPDSEEGDENDVYITKETFYDFHTWLLRDMEHF